MYEKLKEAYPQIVETAEDNGVDVQAIIGDVMDRYGGRSYKESTLLKKVASKLRSEIRVATAATVKGLIVGSRDRFGSNVPIRFPLIQKDGKHLEISTWSLENVPHGNENIELPIPSAAEVKIEKNEQYNSYQLLDIVDYKIVDKPTILKLLKSVSMTPSQLRDSMALKVVVVRGTISGIQPMAKFEEGEKVGDQPIMTTDARDQENYWPTMQIILKPDGETKITRISMERMRYAKPYYDVQDMYSLCEDVSGMFNDPEKQAEEISGFIVGTEVVVVGVLTKLTKTRSGEDNVRYANIGACAVIEDTGAEQVEQKVAEKAEEEHEEESKEEITYRPYSGELLDSDLGEFKVKPFPPADYKESGKDGWKVVTGEFEDNTYGDVTAAIRMKEDALQYLCDACESKGPCEHVLGLWAVCRSVFMPEEKKPEKKQKKSDVVKIKEQVTAYLKVINSTREEADQLTVHDINAGTVIDGLGIKDVPTSVIEEALKQLREKND